MKKIPVFVRITVKLYLLLLAIYFVFRVALLLLNLNRLGEATTWEVIQAFIMGVRFDIVTIGFVIAIPTIALTICSFWGTKCRIFEKIYTIILTICFTVTFGICAADIPYFDQFFDRFNITAFEWMATGDSVFVFKMIFEEPTYILMMLPVLASGFVFWYFCNKILKNSIGWEDVNYWQYGIYTILLWGLVFIGMRGRLNEKSPIMVGTAYFCNNALLNQLGLNPNFTLARSYLDSKDPDNQSVSFMSDYDAIKNVQEYLGIENPNPDFPIARTPSFRAKRSGVEKSSVIENQSNDYNVIVVIMEGMSYNKTAHGGNTHNLTPFLDSLMDRSLSFNNCYTTGTHTYCGIYSTSVSYPVIFRNQALKRIPVLQYDGLAATLQREGYQTAYFTTHDKEFDNVAGFLSQNGVERIVSQADYPISEVKTTLGVPDDYMFRFAMPIFDEMASNNRPFCATMMTASDHGPFYLPDYFKPKNTELKYQMTEYADWSLRRFIEMATEKPWFDNTLFVFVADHGAVLDSDYSIPLSYFHTPLIFYMPEHLQAALNENIASQMDIFPTVMGILGKNYVNNTFGIDLMSEERPYVYFMGDDKYGVLDGEWLFINKPAEEQKGLYRYQEKEKKNYISDYPNVASEMQKYGESAWQVSEYQIVKKKTKFLSHE
ncbi:MAG: sulfatase-like hydrolase/transferase [Bacteroidales bacterium]|nr:sulfatase-like hydrolase/transferase [Bacteroidales bacterium]